MQNTKAWAAAHGLCVDDTVPPISECTESHKRKAEEVATRTIVLHCVAAVGYGVDSNDVIEWLQDQSVWGSVSSNEQAFFHASTPSEQQRSDARWRQEAQWALLWSLGKIGFLGLPTHMCDTALLVDEIMPALGDPVDEFVKSAALRPPSEVLSEDDRIYNLHCYARQADREETLPDDLIYEVLFQRHYAFEWLSGDDDWDSVSTDT